MLKELIGAIFGSQNERDIKKIKPIVEKINSLEPDIQKLSDDQLKAKTEEFRKKLWTNCYRKLLHVFVKLQEEPSGLGILMFK